MLDLSQAQLKRLTAIHGWSAVVLGLLLYAVIATGAVAVFANEIGRWSVGGVRERPPLEERLDASIRGLAAQVDPAFLHDVGIWDGEAGDLHVFFHEHRLNPASGVEEDFGTMFRAEAASGRVLERHDGFFWNDPEAWETSALRQFFVDLHVQLYLPEPLGADPHRDPRADDDGGGDLGGADAPPPGRATSSWRSGRGTGWSRRGTGTCWRRAGGYPSRSCSPSPARSSASPAR